MTEAPALRQHEVAKILGCSTRFLRKLMDTGALDYETLPGGTERRVPAREVARLRPTAQQKREKRE